MTRPARRALATAVAASLPACNAIFGITPGEPFAGSGPDASSGAPTSVPAGNPLEAGAPPNSEGGIEASTGGDGATSGEAGVGVPDDVACSGPWTNTTDPNCTQRMVAKLDDGVFVDALGIACTRSGRLGVLEGNTLGQGGVRVFTFNRPQSAAFDSRGISHVGRGDVGAIASGGDETFHTVSYDPNTSALVYWTLDPMGVWGPRLDIATSFPNGPTTVGLRVLPNGDVLFAYRDNGRKKISSRLLHGTTFGPAVDVASCDTGAEWATCGPLALHMADADSVGLAFTYPVVVIGQGGAAPAHATFSAGTWSAPEDVDSRKGLALGSGTASSAGTTWSSYLFQPAGSDTAELDIASTHAGATPTSTALVKQIFPGGQGGPTFASIDSVAMAVDAGGLVHVAAFVATSVTDGEVLYARQARQYQGGGSGTVWVVDVIDDHAGSQGLVDITIDPWGRPHIVYAERAPLGGTQPAVFYATRFDR